MQDPRDQPLPFGITFDVEHWYQATLVADSVERPEDRIEASVRTVLDVLDDHGVEGTFFVVGTLAEEYPELVSRIHDAGHELGSHGHTHTPLYGKSPEWLRGELAASRGAIRDAAGVEPTGFRAPNFSITRETDWAFDVLRSSDFRYDSSVFPAWTPMYGVSGAPVRPYDVVPDRPFHRPGGVRGGGELVEFPLAVHDSVVRVPIAGGFYGRVLPRRLLQYGLDRYVRRGHPATLYFHPWEFNPATRDETLPFAGRFISHAGIDRLRETVEWLLEAYEFRPLGRVIDELGGLEGTRAEPPDTSGGPVRATPGGGG